MGIFSLFSCLAMEKPLILDLSQQLLNKSFQTLHDSIDHYLVIPILMTSTYFQADSNVMKDLNAEKKSKRKKNLIRLLRAVSNQKQLF